MIGANMEKLRCDKIHLQKIFDREPSLGKSKRGNTNDKN